MTTTLDALHGQAVASLGSAIDHPDSDHLSRAVAALVAVAREEALATVGGAHAETPAPKRYCAICRADGADYTLYICSTHYKEVGAQQHIPNGGLVLGAAEVAAVRRLVEATDSNDLTAACRGCGRVRAMQEPHGRDCPVAAVAALLPPEVTP